MNRIRVEEHDAEGNLISSTPYCTCSKCGCFMNPDYAFCPWDGHKFVKGKKLVFMDTKTFAKTVRRRDSDG